MLLVPSLIHPQISRSILRCSQRWGWNCRGKVVMGPKIPDVQEWPWTFCSTADLGTLSNLRLIGPFWCLVRPNVIKDSLPAFASTSGDEVSSTDIEESNAAEKADLEKPLATSEEKTGKEERHIQEFEHVKDFVDDLVTNVEEHEAKLWNIEEQVRFFEDKVSEESKQLVEKDASSSSFAEHVVVLERTRRVHRLRLSVLPESIQSKRMCLMVSVKLLLVTRQLCISVLRRMLRSVKSYWLKRWLPIPNFGSSGKICRPIFVRFSRLWTTRWIALVRLIVNALSYWSPDSF